MHDIEPYFKWKNYYDSSRDEQSPYFGKKYDEFYFKNKIYNYLIHPQWDEFGSPTLYLKILFVDYEKQAAIIEFIGEWNDAVTNDIMLLKRKIIDPLIESNIRYFILLCDNVLNFHGSDDCYYEEWLEDMEYGWITTVNTLEHVRDEMFDTGLEQYLNLGDEFQDIYWQKYQPNQLFDLVEDRINRSRIKELH